MFNLGNNQMAKINLDVVKKNQKIIEKLENQKDLKNSCLNLIDQLSYYYDNFYENFKIDEVNGKEASQQS